MSSKHQRKFLQRTRTLRAIAARPAPKPGNTTLANVRNVQIAEPSRSAHPSRVLSKLIKRADYGPALTYESWLRRSNRHSAIQVATR